MGLDSVLDVGVEEKQAVIAVNARALEEAIAAKVSAESAKLRAVWAAEEAREREERGRVRVAEAAEQESRARAEREAAEELRRMDTDGDGVVDLEEFLGGGGTKQE